LTYFFATIIPSSNPTFVPSLSENGDLSCITSCLVLPGFLVDTLLIWLKKGKFGKSSPAKVWSNLKKIEIPLYLNRISSFVNRWYINLSYQQLSKTYGGEIVINNI